eukprot:m.560129 g.560129  ORF g.560129 m.560129 type:complete len:328 (+) comp57785_c0_seq17:1590-2573(+)
MASEEQSSPSSVREDRLVVIANQPSRVKTASHSQISLVPLESTSPLPRVDVEGSHAMRCLAVNVPLNLVAVGGLNQVIIRSLSDLHVVHVCEHSFASEVWSLAWVQNGQRLLAGDASGTITVFDARDWSVLKTIAAHTANVRAIAEANGHFISVSFDGMCRVWHSSTLEPTLEFSEHGAAVNACITLPRADPVVVTGGENSRLFVWNYQTGEVLQRLQLGDDGYVVALRAIPGTRLFVGGSISGALACWDSGTLELVWSVRFASSIRAIMPTADPSRILVCRYPAIMELCALENGSVVRQGPQIANTVMACDLVPGDAFSHIKAADE